MIRKRGYAMEELPDPERVQELLDAFDVHYEASDTKGAVVAFLRGMGSSTAPGRA